MSHASVNISSPVSNGSQKRLDHARKTRNPGRVGPDTLLPRPLVGRRAGHGTKTTQKTKVVSGNGTNGCD